MQKASIYTKIINRQHSAHRIYEDDRVIAFLTDEPIAEGHTLVVPKKQIDQIWDLDEDDYEYVWKVSRKIARHIRDKMGCPRVSIVVEGFNIPHMHIHLFPVYKRGDTHLPKRPSSDNQLAIVAEKLKM